MYTTIGRRTMQHCVCREANNNLPLCTPARRNTPTNRQSAESRAADRIICTWITLFAEAKSKSFFCCMFFG